MLTRPRQLRLAISCAAVAALLLPVREAAVAADPAGPTLAAASAEDGSSTPIPSSPEAPTAAPTPSTPPTPDPIPSLTPPPIATPPPTSTPIPTPTTTKEPTVTRARHGRVAVGDSLMVGAASLMRARGFTVNGQVGRQFSVAPAIVRSFGSSLKRNVVIELGTNGTVSLTTCRAVVRAAGAHRRVFLVTNRVPRSWQDSNNRVLRRCDQSFGTSRVRIIDWHAASAGQSSWFVSDGIHPSSRGRVAFATLIDRAVDRHGL